MEEKDIHVDELLDSFQKMKDGMLAIEQSESIVKLKKVFKEITDFYSSSYFAELKKIVEEMPIIQLTEEIEKTINLLTDTLDQNGNAIKTFFKENSEYFRYDFKNIIPVSNSSNIVFSQEQIYQFKAKYVIYTLRSLKWPYYLFVSKWNIDELFDCFSTSTEIELSKIKDYICSSVDNDINQIYESWTSNEIISKKRIPLLEEAIRDYKDERYASSVTLLLSQTDGMLDDMINFMHNNSIEENKNKKLQYEDYYFGNHNLKPKSFNSKVISILSIFDDKEEINELCAEYIMKIIFYSDRKNLGYESQPCRNKVLHGSNLCFNTKEHAVKTILTIDMLEELATSLVVYKHNRS